MFSLLEDLGNGKPHRCNQWQVVSTVTILYVEQQNIKFTFNYPPNIRGEDTIKTKQGTLKQRAKLSD